MPPVGPDFSESRDPRDRGWQYSGSPQESLADLVSRTHALAAQRASSRLSLRATTSPYGEAVEGVRAFFEALQDQLNWAQLNTVFGDALDDAQRELLTAPNNPLLLAFNDVFAPLEAAARDFKVPLLATVTPEVLATMDRASAKAAVREVADKLKACRGFTADQLAKFTDQGEFCCEARVQEHGPGSYVIINHILNNTPGGSSFLGHGLDRVFLDAPVAEAHRQRIRDLAQILNAYLSTCPINEKVSFLSVGCGPARELVEWIQPHSRPRIGPAPLISVPFDETWSDPKNLQRLRAHLLDSNPHSLSYASSAVNRAMSERGASALDGPTLEMSQLDIIRHVLKQYRSGGKDVLPPDSPRELYSVIICAGLEDYFGDEMALLLRAFLYDHLKPGGYLVETFVAPGDPHECIREMVLGWPLVTRDRARLITHGEGLRKWSENLRTSGACIVREPPTFSGKFNDDVREVAHLTDLIKSNGFAAGSFSIIDGFKLPGGAEGINQYQVTRRNTA